VGDGYHCDRVVWLVGGVGLEGRFKQFVVQCKGMNGWVVGLTSLDLGVEL
jgi:hypothetical protein